jgi:hypothetical protein
MWDQLRWVVGLLTGHCHLKGHLFKLGLSNSTTCERCQEENETATHIRLCHLDQYFMEPSDFRHAHIQNPMLHSKRKGRHNRSLWSRCEGQEGPPLIHSFIQVGEEYGHFDHNAMWFRGSLMIWWRTLPPSTKFKYNMAIIGALLNFHGHKKRAFFSSSSCLERLSLISNELCLRYVLTCSCHCNVCLS